MEKILQEIREQQRASWNKFSPGWKKWDEIMMEFLRPMGEKMIQLLNLKDTDLVLDIAAGTGEPGLTIASIVKNGKVTITDLSEDMLSIARENAERKGLANTEFIACDVCRLPFPDNSFDAISCRLGFMFFPDMRLAAREMMRVLKPGGRLVASVWDVPEKNFWVTAIGSTINKHMQLAPPPPDAPGIFRCAGPGLMKELFRGAGVKNISVSEVQGRLTGLSAETYWTMMTEVAAPLVAALSNADEALRDKIQQESIALVHSKYPDGNTTFEGHSLVIYGEK